MPNRNRLNPPHAVRKIADRLEDAGYETWCVGGAVRDALLGRTHLDWDLATQATPDVVQSLFRVTKPIGIEFGTVGVLDRHGTLHEVTTFRRDVRTDGRHAEVEYGASLDEDLARRDFTINAIAYSPRRDELRDPFDGRVDLERRIVRAVGDADARMREDRLRALRALRFAARFDFTIDPTTWQAIVSSAPYLGRLSRERVKQELEKTMEQVCRPSIALELWRAAGALTHLIPELAAQPAVVFQAADNVGLPEHTNRPELSSTRLHDRLGTLFLDIAPRDTRRVLRDLRFSNRAVHWIANLVESWHALHLEMATSLLSARPVPGNVLRRWIARVGRTAVRDFLRVCGARWTAERALGVSAPSGQVVSALYRVALRSAYRDPVALTDLAISGDDLADLGITPGPRVGATLRWLLEQVLEEPSRNTRRTLLELARLAPHASSPGEGEAKGR